MSVKSSLKRLATISLASLTFSGCFQPPFNNFKEEPPSFKRTITGAGVGAITGTFLGNTLLGAALGATAGSVVNVYRTNKHGVVSDLQKQDIQFIEYGDTLTLIVPTDHYYQFNSPRLNELCFAGLNNIIKLLEFYPCTRIYVAGFTDDVGTNYHKRMLTQARAETMVSFIWAHGIPAQLLKAEGYGDKNSVGDNQLIRGSAYNRRIEIQWTNLPEKPQPAVPLGIVQK
jgi:outer membrane protein OmpA-like peptidoglycan-associated protein